MKVSGIALQILWFHLLLLIRCSWSKGCVSLDTYSFDKVVSKFDAALIKFDTAYPYGEKHDRFEQVCASSRHIDGLLVGEVPVKDYGDEDNADLAKRYGVLDKADYPVVKLFVRGREEPLAFVAKSDDEFTEGNLKKFIRLNSDVYIGLPGCLEPFDKLATRFAVEKCPVGRKGLIREAEELWDGARGTQEQKSAAAYVKVMRRMQEAGDDFVVGEVARVKKIVAGGKASREKLEEMQQRLNILQAFIVRPQREEL